MVDIKEYDERLYRSLYGLPKEGNYNQIWNEIKSNYEVLNAAIKVKRNKFDTYNIVIGIAICDSILTDYKNVDKDIYKKLVNLIYSDTDIARLVVDGASNGGFSFLLMTLFNHELKLTKKQKDFAVSEAMNKLGTVKSRKQQEEIEKEIESLDIDENKETIINFDGFVTPISVKSLQKYMCSLFSSMDRKQAHGKSPFDIRYHILRNPNWTFKEKEKLVYDFWYDDEEYDECLEQWEWGIINDPVNVPSGVGISSLDKGELYYYTYDQLLDFYKSAVITDKIWNEINFCKLMHKLRPQEWEKEVGIKIKKRTNN